MKYRRRVFFTDKQKSEIWDRWQRGETMRSIERGFDRSSSSIYPLLARTGGIRLPDRVRSRLALTLTKREEISRGLIEQLSLRSIARTLKRSVSMISREVRRNGGCANHIHLGNVVQTKILTAHYHNTSQKAQICRYIVKQS